jgi:hypothetical protein
VAYTGSDGMKDSTKLFTARETLPSEMGRLTRLRFENPKLASTVLGHGENLVRLARTGNLRQLVAVLEHSPEVSARAMRV